MKKRVWSLPVFIFVALVFSQCQKEENVVMPSDQSLIENARKFFNESLVTADAELSCFPDTKSMAATPAWENAYVKEISTGNAVVVPIHYNVPLSVKNTLDESRYYGLDNLTRLFIYKDQYDAYHVELVTSLPDRENEVNSTIFSGVVRVSDLQGNLLKAFRYEKDGRIRKLGKVSPDPASRMQTILICTTVYGYNYSITNPDDGYHWSETTCEYFTYDDGDYGGGSGGSSGGDYGGGGSGGGGTPPGDGNNPCGGAGPGLRIDPSEPCDTPFEPSEIINSMQNPCYREVTNMFLNSTGQVSAMIQHLFGTNDNMMLFFEEGKVMNDSGNHDYAEIVPYSTAEVNGAVIILDRIKHLHASKEFVASTLIHEAVHAYLHMTDRANNTEEMLSQPYYFNMMVNTLRSMFPHLSLQTAQDLMWVGLEGTAAYDALSLDVKNRIEDVSTNYELGEGIPCHH